MFVGQTIAQYFIQDARDTCWYHLSSKCNVEAHARFVYIHETHMKYSRVMRV